MTCGNVTDEELLSRMRGGGETCWPLVMFNWSPFFDDDHYYHHCCCCSSCLAGRALWPRLGAAAAPPPPRPLQSTISIFRALLSAVMAVGSLASFNPSLPPAHRLAEGMPLRTNPPPAAATYPALNVCVVVVGWGGGGQQRLSGPETCTQGGQKVGAHPIGAAAGSLRGHGL